MTYLDPLSDANVKWTIGIDRYFGLLHQIGTEKNLIKKQVLIHRLRNCREDNKRQDKKRFIFKPQNKC